MVYDQELYDIFLKYIQTCPVEGNSIEHVNAGVVIWKIDSSLKMLIKREQGYLNTVELYKVTPVNSILIANSNCFSFLKCRNLRKEIKNLCNKFDELDKKKFKILLNSKFIFPAIIRSWSSYMNKRYVGIMKGFNTVTKLSFFNAHIDPVYIFSSEEDFNTAVAEFKLLNSTDTHH